MERASGRLLKQGNVEVFHRKSQGNRKNLMTLSNSFCAAGKDGTSQRYRREQEEKLLAFPKRCIRKASGTALLCSGPLNTLEVSASDYRRNTLQRLSLVSHLAVESAHGCP